MTHRRKLPIGVQNFAKIRGDNYYYVDKTPFVHRLIEQGSYYFLSRPRRFGKSLFLDTLKELFEGNEVLFRGLYIHDQWDWARKHPVIRISFGAGVMRTREELDVRIHEMLTEQSRYLGVNVESQSIAGQMAELLTKAATRHGARTVLLIDEYDKPILDNLSDSNAAREMREGLKNLYSAIKDCDASIQFCLLTGVSKFSKVSLFSGLNNLEDITLDAAYSAICGYTDADVDHVFAPELPGLDRDEIRRWYNGYNWLGESVYNPFDLLLLFQKRMFRPYWFETATPTFLVDLLARRGLPTVQLTALQTDLDLLGRFDVDDIGTEALLFQTGYLTIRQADQPMPGMWSYLLGFPNYEVETSLNKAMLPSLGVNSRQVVQQRMSILQALRAQDFSLLQAQFKALFASIPYHWYTNNPIAQYEGYYASVFYSYLAAVGLTLIPEEVSNAGRVDLAIDFEQQILLVEFKVVAEQATGDALAQLKARNYAAKYQASGKAVFLVGIEFSQTDRQIVGFEWERF